MFYICSGAAIISIAILRIKPFALHKKLALTACLLTVYILASTLWANNIPPVANIAYHSKRAFEIIALLLLIGCFFDVSYHKPLFRLSVAVATLHAAVIIPFHNLNARLPNPIDTAMIFGIAAIIALHFALKEQNPQSALFFAAYAILLIVILMSKSRGPQLALIITSIAVMVLQKKHLHKIVPYAVCSIALICLITLKTNVFARIFSRGFSVNQRDLLWKETILNSFDNFWFGFGMQKKLFIHLPNGNSYTHSHNFIMDTFRLTGLTGFCIIVFLYLYALHQGFNSRMSDYQLWALILLFGSLCLMTNGKIPFTRPGHAWLAFWVPIAMICTLPQATAKVSRDTQ